MPGMRAADNSTGMGGLVSQHMTRVLQGIRGAGLCCIRLRHKHPS